MAELSENNKGYLKSLVASGGKGVVPALVFAKLREPGYVEKVEGETAGRGKTVVTITFDGKQAAV